MKIKTIIMAFLLAISVVACSPDNVKEDSLGTAELLGSENGVESNVYNADGTRVTAIDLQNSSLTEADDLMQSAEFSDPNSPLSTRIIYFEYDSSQVRNEFISILEAHANYLMANPSQRVTLDGHSDERGTREYNIALGEQRAKSVFKMMRLIGVMANQIDIVSYGEEKPASLELNDDSFALNRRVEVVYK